VGRRAASARLKKDGGGLLSIFEGGDTMFPLRQFGEQVFHARLGFVVSLPEEMEGQDRTLTNFIHSRSQVIREYESAMSEFVP
jgi:hypothetical protein